MRTFSKALSLTGLATRAGKTVSGEFASEKAVKSGNARLVLVAEDASANTKKKFSDSCRFYQVPFRTIGDRESLGKAVGKDFRATVVITDAGLAQAVLTAMEKEPSTNRRDESDT